MKTILEVFYLRVVEDRVRYQRKEVNLSRKGSDPDQLMQSLLREKHHASARDEGPETREFLVHSTSWRYEPPGKVVLTYVAYSDEMEFDKGKWHSLPLKNLKTITKKSQKPRTQAAVEKRVVAHAMRHLAFLIQTEGVDDYERALAPETRKVFEELWVSLAGKVF